MEFQHSRLHPDERIAREAFHRNMVWIVDGLRLMIANWKHLSAAYVKGRSEFRSHR
jgi:competence protein CoiA